MAEKNDPLEKLLFDKDKINRERLSELLEPFVGIDKESGEPIFRSNFSNLGERQKIVVYLLYRKAAVALGLLNKNEEGVKAKKLSESTGVNYNTARSLLSQESCIEKDKNKGGYLVPGYSFDMASEVIGVEN